MNRVQVALGALVLAQAAHSVEECVGRLWESFPPARFVSGLIAEDLERGFLLANVVVVALGVWTWLGPVRRKERLGESLAWVWVVIEAVNGVAHSAWALYQGRYTPGLVTAPLLLVLALVLARQLRQVHHEPRTAS